MTFCLQFLLTHIQLWNTTTSKNQTCLLIDSLNEDYKMQTRFDVDLITSFSNDELFVECTNVAAYDNMHPWVDV